jgi:hypothetical protein
LTIYKMLLTQCAVCATELGLSSGKKCGRCGPECQVQHWKEGGHDKLCKLIKKAGGAEQYHANKKYTEAVTVAADACAEDTKGQTCYICTQALHWKTKEGLVRGCSCRGTAGFVHVSCLAEQAKILVTEAEENNLDAKALNAKLDRWHTCSLCEQRHHGVVSCALGWACWKTYLGRPEADQIRLVAINVLGLGLNDTRQHADALSVGEAELSTLRRIDAPEYDILVAQGNLANTYKRLGRPEHALRMKRDVYYGNLKILGEEDESTFVTAANYANSLLELRHFEEAKAVLRKMMPVARRVLGDSDDTTLRMRSMYAVALSRDTGSSLDDRREAVTTLEETARTARRVLGDAKPLAAHIEHALRDARAMLAAPGLGALAL